MKAILRNENTIKRFRDVVKLLSTVNEEQTLLFTPEGVKAATMDPSHVSMVIALIKPEAFDDYSVEEETQMTLNLKDFQSRLDMIEPKEEQLSIEPDKEKAKLHMNILSSKTGRKRRLDISLLEPVEEEVPVPKIIFKARGRILFEDWEDAVKDAQLASEHIAFAILKVEEDGKKETQVHMASHGDTSDSFMAAKVLEGKVDEEAKATFTLSYMSDFVRTAKPLTELVNLAMSTDMPIEIRLETDPSLDCVLYLAPCINP